MRVSLCVCVCGELILPMLMIYYDTLFSRLCVSVPLKNKNGPNTVFFLVEQSICFSVFG